MHTILVIEDDHDIRASLKQALEAEGYTVFSASNGVEGVATLKNIKPPSVIIVDYNMPLMNGKDFLKVKNTEKNLATIPAIGISGAADKSSFGGVHEFVRKPIDLEKLLKAISKFCREDDLRSKK